MTLLVSILTATLFAVFGPPYALYQYWFTWTPLGTIIGTLIYLTMAGGGGGVLGWLAAEVALKANPTQSPWINGFLYGIAGSFTLRADFSSRHVRSTSTRPYQTELANAASLLNASLQWTTALLDTRATRAIELWVKQLTLKPLMDEAFNVTQRISRLDIDDKAKKTLGTQLVEAMEDARSSETRRQEDGRARVRFYVAEFLSNHHTARPGRTPSRPLKSASQAKPPTLTVAKRPAKRLAKRPTKLAKRPATRSNPTGEDSVTEE